MVDVVVVGGGAAGCVVAARVASSSRSVLLLEAGPDLRTKVPEPMRDGWTITREFDWGYRSEPGTNGEPENLRRGRLLGGTSWVTRFTPRGSPADYDDWAARGNPGWGFDEVLPYFRRLETDQEFGDRPWHGSDGPMPSTRYPGADLAAATTAALEAMETAGLGMVDDHNEPGAVGAGRMPMSSRAGVRVTTADAYLPPGGTPAGLTIRGEAEVATVLFDGTRARGVRLTDGTEIDAGRVVLCAGVIGSPAILLRSGVGPADDLRSAGVTPLVDLPGVGANLADHPAVEVPCGAYLGGTPPTGPTMHVIATFHSSEQAAGAPPDLMFWVADPAGDPPTFELEVVLVKPRSRGRIRLRSADPGDAPAIELPGVRDPADVRRLAEGYRRGLEVLAQPALRPFLRPAPEPEGDLHDRIRTEHYSIPHLVGTCAMGPRGADGAVVDATGSVHGTQSLTVADASIMPDVPSGFTHFPTIMIAERHADELASRR